LNVKVDNKNQKADLYRPATLIEGSTSGTMNWEGYYPGGYDIMIIAWFTQKLNYKAVLTDI